MERMSAEGKFFHRSCFRCDYCNILLRLGSYVYHRDYTTFSGKFFCIPHSTENALEKYRYRKKADEIKDDYFSFDGSAHFNSYFNEFLLEIKILCIISGLFHHSFINQGFKLIEIV